MEIQNDNDSAAPAAELLTEGRLPMQPTAVHYAWQAGSFATKVSPFDFSHRRCPRRPVG